MTLRSFRSKVVAWTQTQTHTIDLPGPLKWANIC